MSMKVLTNFAIRSSCMATGCTADQGIGQFRHGPVLRTNVSRYIHRQLMSFLYRLAFQQG